MAASSSSNSGVIIFILLALAAAAIIGLNEANHGYFKNGAKDITDFIDRFRQNESFPAPKTQNPSARVKSSPAAGDKRLPKDELGRRDRAELNELLEKIN